MILNLNPNLNQNRIVVIMENLPMLIPNGHQLLLTKWESCHDFKGTKSKVGL